MKYIFGKRGGYLLYIMILWRSSRSSYFKEIEDIATLVASSTFRNSQTYWQKQFGESYQRRYTSKYPIWVPQVFK